MSFENLSDTGLLFFFFCLPAQPQGKESFFPDSLIGFRVSHASICVGLRTSSVQPSVASICVHKYFLEPLFFLASSNQPSARFKQAPESMKNTAL